MKLNFEVEIDEERIIKSIEGGNGYSFTDLAISQIREDILNRITAKIDAKSFSDEMQTDFARGVRDKIATLSMEKVKEYLSDESIQKMVDSKLKWQVDCWLEKNMNEYFTKMRDGFVFMTKEEYQIVTSNPQ